MNSYSSSASRYRRSLYHQHDELISSIKGARDLIPHSGEKGSEIEEKIREALTLVLPEKIGVSHGFVIDSEDNQSRQMDVVLYDKMNTPKIYTGDKVQIFPVESTYACGEIKTKLNANSLKDSFKKNRSYKKLHRKAYIDQPSPIETSNSMFGEESMHWKSIFFCIAYESSRLEDLHNSIKDYHANLPIYRRIV